MSATDELRLLLDERGVEHKDGYELTEWLDEQGRTVIATDSVAKYRLNCRKMVVRRVMTPEQAIIATLGNDGPERSNDGVSELEAENAKLRELMRDTLIQTYQYCDKYGIEYKDGTDAWEKANDDIDRRLRELGVVE